MDDAGKSAALFLEKMTALRDGLYRELWNQFSRHGVYLPKINPIQLCASPCGHGVVGEDLMFTGGLITGFLLKSRSGNSAIIFSLIIKWDEKRWLVTTEVEKETDDEIEFSQPFPDRYAATLHECFDAIDLAANDLRKYANHIVEQNL